MDTILKLAPGENVVACTVPAVEAENYPVCQECGQPAYRVVVIKGGAGRRNVAVCGPHFVSASLQVPALQQFERGGKMG